MPNDNIQRSIKKAAGGEDGGNYDPITYEGYGSKGVAFIVECLTDNRNRTAADVRHLFDKYNGSLGTSGSVTYMFDYKGVIVIPKSERVQEDDVMMLALDNGADDVVSEDDCFEVMAKPEALHDLNKAFEAEGIEVASSEVEYVPQNYIALDKDSAATVSKLIISLEDLDDVQNVYTNADLSALDEQ